MTINEKVAHLKGVMEGMKFDTESNEGKLIGLMADILADIAEELDMVSDDVDTLYDFADELDEDLGDVEELLYGEDFACDEECDDDDFDTCEGCDGAELGKCDECNSF